MADLKPFEVTSNEVDYVVFSMFGGDNNLSHFVDMDLGEMAAGNRGNIAVLGLADYAKKPASVIEVAPDGTISVLEQLGEIDTGDPEVLAQFLSRALVTYPSSKKAIGFWDHGTGVFEEEDKDEKLLVRSKRLHSYRRRRLFFPKSRLAKDENTKAMLHDDTNGGVLTTLEAGKMLAAAYSRADFQGKVDLIYSDTCLNGMVEVVEEIGAFAECIVGSSDLEPGDGWNYTLWFEKTGQNPPQTPADWARQAVEAFGQHYADKPLQFPCTLGAFRRDDRVIEAFRHLIQTAERSGLADGFYVLDRARGLSQPFDHRDSYDLIDFCDQIIALSDPDFRRDGAGDGGAMSDAAQSLKQACLSSRIHSVALGEIVEASHGISFWFPSNRRMMRKDRKTYKNLAFDQRTGWTRYLGEWM